MAELYQSNVVGADVLIGKKYREDPVDSHNHNLIQDCNDNVLFHHHEVVRHRNEVVAAIGHSNEVEAALGNRIEVETAVGDRSEVVAVVCHHPIQDSDREPD